MSIKKLLDILVYYPVKFIAWIKYNLEQEYYEKYYRDDKTVIHVPEPEELTVRVSRIKCIPIRIETYNALMLDDDMRLLFEHEERKAIIQEQPLGYHNYYTLDDVKNSSEDVTITFKIGLPDAYKFTPGEGYKALVNHADKETFWVFDDVGRLCLVSNYWLN